MEKYIVFNPTSSVISFQLKPNIDLGSLEGVARHKVRRIVRGGFLPVVVQPHTSLDLVEYSGMTLKELKSNSELHILLRKGVLQVIETKLTVEVPDEEIVEEPKKDLKLEKRPTEGVPTEEPEVKLPSPPKEEVKIDISPEDFITKEEVTEDTTKVEKPKKYKKAKKKKGVQLFKKAKGE